MNALRRSWVIPIVLALVTLFPTTAAWASSSVQSTYYTVYNSNVNGLCLQQHIYEDDVSGSPHMDSWTALEQTSSIYQACGNGFGEMQFWDRQDLWQWNGSQWADVNAGPWVPNNGSWQADTGYNFPSPPGGAGYFEPEGIAYWSNTEYVIWPNSPYYIYIP